jgi:glycosyltransferase involved in cell wall biosynthesis
MKILMLSDFYPPVIGGMERHVQLLSEGLTKRGHKVTVCTVGHKHLPVFRVENGVKVFRFRGFFQRIPFLFKDLERKYHPPIRDWMITKKIGKLIETEKPDIIHAHGWITYSVLPLKKKLTIPLVVTLHDYGFVCPKRILMNGNEICEEPFKYNCIECGKESYGVIKSFFSFYGVYSNKSKLKLVDKFIAVSSFVKEVYSRHLALSNKKIAVIPNFYDVEKRNPVLVENKTLPEDFILFVGVLAPSKGVDVLIEAYNTLNIETKLVLLGKHHPNFPYEGNKNIMIIEDVPHEIVMEAYSKCRFVVIPSKCADSGPIVAVEAMSCKKAIIASNIGGLRDIIVNGKTGMLVPFNDSKKLTQAIRFLLKSPSTANEMGKNGFKRFMRNYTSDIVVPKIEKIYANLRNKND